MNKQRLILYIFFLFINIFIIEYYNIADAQIKLGGGSAPWVEITAPTKNNDESITDTTILIIDDADFSADNVLLEASTSADISNFNCVFSPEEMICELFSGCNIHPPRVNCTLDVNSSGDLYISVFDAGLQTVYAHELDYVIEENQSQSQSSSSNNRTRKSGYSVRFTCKDKKALNYDQFGRHNESLCKYPKKVAVSHAVILQLIDLLEDLKIQLSSHTS